MFKLLSFLCYFPIPRPRFMPIADSGCHELWKDSEADKARVWHICHNNLRLVSQRFLAFQGQAA